MITQCYAVMITQCCWRVVHHAAAAAARRVSSFFSGLSQAQGRATCVVVLSNSVHWCRNERGTTGAFKGKEQVYPISSTDRTLSRHKRGVFRGCCAHVMAAVHMPSGKCFNAAAAS